MMRRKSSKGRLASKSTTREDTEKTVYVHRSVKTPTKAAENYLQDERWDITPKTDYTYAKSASYSPRFFGKKYVSPNMSRYRIRSKGGRSGYQDSGEDDLPYIEYSDDEDIVTQGRQCDDSDSDVSYETVLEEGIELRSGKNLQNIRQKFNEHDTRLQGSENVTSANNRLSYTTSKMDLMSRSRRDGYDENTNAVNRSSRKGRKSLQNQKQYSQSEHKRYPDTFVDSYSRIGSGTDYSNVRSRRSLNTDFSKNRSLKANRNVSVQSNSNLDRQSSRLNYDETDSGTNSSGYSLRTVRKTLTQEFEELDDKDGVEEKGSVEMSEKLSRSHQQKKNQNENRVHLYGLDSDDEFSDTNSSSSRRSRYSTSNGSGNSDTTTITTIVTTITETFTTITRPIVAITSPVVTPVLNNVGRPVWNNVIHPVISFVSSSVSTVLFLSWLLASQPISYLVRSVGTLLSWFWTSGAEDVAESLSSVSGWIWRQMEYIMMQFILMDVFLFKRRKGHGCCLCLPLLLLLPLLFALFTGADLWSGKSAIIGLFSQEKSSPQIVTNANSEYLNQLNTEVRTLILQLQSSNQNQLTAANVEEIVHRILNKETAALKADLDDSRNQDASNQLLWKNEQAVKLEQMQAKHNDLLSGIQNLEAVISGQRAVIAEQGAGLKSESRLHLENLEEKLAALQAELHDLEKEHAALLLRVNACCHNETYYAGAVKDSVNVILAEMMAGHMSGNPSQDVFTDWLHSNYVSKETLDKRLQDLAVDLTGSVMALMKEQQDAYQLQQQQQQQQHQHQDQQVLLTGNLSNVGEQHVRLMIQEALVRYSADKTGLADFALESAGGTVVSTRCSETYYRKTALISVLGVPLWYTSNSPRTVIQPEVLPGQCWAFRGSQGYIVIQTSTTITPSGFTLEHIPKSLAPTGEIDSAPKGFTVLGLKSEYDDNSLSLGNYTYNDDGNPMQFFPVQVTGNNGQFSIFELRILSNYGNVEYTCLYRFRIHGKPYKPSV